MAYQNKFISNPKTGQDFKFLKTAKDTNGALLEMESSFKPHSREPAAHYHPHQEEDFTVLSGELTVRIDGQLKVYKQNESFHIPANKVHAMWNNSDSQTKVHWKVQPALDSEYFLETGIGLAIDGKTNEDGMPKILQIALMANAFTHVYRLAKPPFFVQKILFLLLTPFAWLLGYRPTYKKYLN